MAMLTLCPIFGVVLTVSACVNPSDRKAPCVCPRVAA